MSNFRGAHESMKKHPSARHTTTPRKPLASENHLSSGNYAWGKALFLQRQFPPVKPTIPSPRRTPLMPHSLTPARPKNTILSRTASVPKVLARAAVMSKVTRTTGAAKPTKATTTPRAAKVSRVTSRPATAPTQSAWPLLPSPPPRPPLAISKRRTKQQQRKSQEIPSNSKPNTTQTECKTVLSIYPESRFEAVSISSPRRVDSLPPHTTNLVCYSATAQEPTERADASMQTRTRYSKITPTTKQPGLKQKLCALPRYSEPSVWTEFPNETESSNNFCTAPGFSVDMNCPSSFDFPSSQEQPIRTDYQNVPYFRTAFDFPVLTGLSSTSDVPVIPGFSTTKTPTVVDLNAPYDCFNSQPFLDPQINGMPTVIDVPLPQEYFISDPFLGSNVAWEIPTCPTSSIIPESPASPSVLEYLNLPQSSSSTSHLSVLDLVDSILQKTQNVNDNFEKKAEQLNLRMKLHDALGKKIDGMEHIVNYLCASSSAMKTPGHKQVGTQEHLKDTDIELEEDNLEEPLRLRKPKYRLERMFQLTKAIENTMEYMGDMMNEIDAAGVPFRSNANANETEKNTQFKNVQQKMAKNLIESKPSTEIVDAVAKIIQDTKKSGQLSDQESFSSGC